MKATITLEYDDPKISDAIANAVSPDNFETPKGLFVKTMTKGCNVFTEVKSEGKLATFIATIDDLLFCVSTAEKTLHSVTEPT